MAKKEKIIFNSGLKTIERNDNIILCSSCIEFESKNRDCCVSYISLLSK